jgi:hypothetical protein
MLTLSDKGCIDFPNLTQALPESTLRLLVQRVYGVYSYKGRAGHTVQQIGPNEGETPITTRFNSFHYHYNIVSRLWFRDCVTNNSRRGRHRLHGSEQRCTSSSEQAHAFPLFQNCMRVSCKGHTVHAQDSPGSNGGGPPSWLISALYLHGLGLTFVTHATACVPSIWKLLVLLKELRIRHIIHMSFRIILNYYSQGLSPLNLTLSPFSHLPAPNPLPSLQMLSPPSLIHRVSLHMTMFIFY